MSIFCQISSLASFLDNEVSQLEVSYELLEKSLHIYMNGGSAAKISVGLKKDIIEMTDKLDVLTCSAQGSHERFGQFIQSITEAIAEIDQKVAEIEEHAANFGYIKPQRNLQDLESITKVEEAPSSQDRLEVMESPKLLLAGLSKQTLKALGINLPDNNTPPTTVKKVRGANSQVEISPGLCVKKSQAQKCEQNSVRPLIDAGQHQSQSSPQLPLLTVSPFKNKTFRLRKMAEDKEN